MPVSKHVYGGETYPPEIIVINPAMLPDDFDAPVDSLYDFNNRHLTANDIETLQSSLPIGMPVTLLNPETHAIAMVSTDGLSIYPPHRYGWAHLWRRHAVATPLEPEQQSLLVHEQDYLRDAE